MRPSEEIRALVPHYRGTGATILDLADKVEALEATLRVKDDEIALLRENALTPEEANYLIKFGRWDWPDDREGLEFSILAKLRRIADQGDRYYCCKNHAIYAEPCDGCPGGCDQGGQDG